MAEARATRWYDNNIARVTEDDGTTAEVVRAELSGYDPDALTWRRVAVDADGQLLTSGSGGGGGAVTQGTSPWVVGDGGGSLTVDGPLTDTQLRASAVPVSGSFYQATQPVSIASAVPVTDNGGNLSIDDGGNLISVDDGGGSLTVDGTVAISGSVGVTQSTSPWVVAGVDASDAPLTASPLLHGARASTATPSAVSADGDAVSIWATRTGAQVVDGGIAHDAVDSGNPVKIGGRAQLAPAGVSTNNDRVDAWFDGLGRLIVGGTKTANAGIDSASELTGLSVAGDIAATPTIRPLMVSNWVYNSGSAAWDRLRGTTNGLQVMGAVAQDAAVAGNPALSGARASTATPTGVDADGDSVFFWATRTGALNVADAGGSLTTDFSGQVVEDVAAAGGETSLLIAGVRNDAGASRTSLDGDFGNLALDAAGRLGVADLGGSLTVDAPVTTPVFVRLSDGAAAISALPVTDNSGSLTVDAPGLPTALGQTTMSASLPVTLASDQSTLELSSEQLPGALGFSLREDSLPVVLASDDRSLGFTEQLLQGILLRLDLLNAAHYRRYSPPDQLMEAR